MYLVMDKNKTLPAFTKVSPDQDGGCPACGEPASMYVLDGTDYCFDACAACAPGVAVDAATDYAADRASHMADRLDYAGSPYATPRDVAHDTAHVGGGAL